MTTENKGLVDLDKRLRLLSAIMDTVASGRRTMNPEIAGDVRDVVCAAFDRIRELEASLAAAHDTTWFWQIVDAAGLNDVSSDEREALARLVRLAARLPAAESRCRKLEAALGAFLPGSKELEEVLYGHFSDNTPATITVPMRDIRTARALLDQADGEEGNG